jgi:hypothetical protein
VDCGSGGCRGTLDGAGVLPPFAVSDTGVPPEDGPAVRLTGAGEVGPYDYRVLDGTSGAAVVAYL